MRRRKGGLHQKLPVVIGVSGLSQGCGTTHLSLTIASYLEQCLGYKTIYIERDPKGQIGLLSKEEQCVSQEQELFRYHGIWIGRDSMHWDIGELAKKGYQGIVFDHGCRAGKLQQELWEHDHIFLLSRQARWRKDSIPSWLEQIKACECEKYHSLIWANKQRECKAFEKATGIDTQMIVFQRDPFELEPAMISYLRETFVK